MFRVPDGWMAAASELGGVIQATKAVKMFQDLASKKGAVVKDRTEVVDVIKRGERGRRSCLLPPLCRFKTNILVLATEE